MNWQESPNGVRTESGVARFRYFCSTAFLIGFGILLLGCGRGAQEQQRRDAKQTTGFAPRSDEPQPAPIDSQSRNSSDERRDTNLVESFAIAGNGDLVLLPVSLGGKEYLFMLDTGTTLHTFDLSLRQYLGNPVRTGSGKTGAADIAIQAFNPPTARTGKLELGKDELVSCADLTMLRYATGKEIHGVLGVPFFKRHVVQIDWDHTTLSVFNAGTPPDAEWSEAFPITFDELGGPVLEALLVEDVPSRFLIDVGVNTTGTLTGDLFNRLADRKLLKITGDRIIAAAGGNVRQFTGRLDELRIGEFRHRNLIFRQGNSNKLGLVYLSRYRVTFDFITQRCTSRRPTGIPASTRRT